MEVAHGKEVFLTLRAGAAEVFGTALEPGERVRVAGQKVAAFSWAGARLELAGTPDVAYESGDTPMAEYLNAHDALEARRAAARRAGGPGPRVLVAGPADAGKSTLTKILINYAVRGGWAPALVDLDLGQGGVTVPGCLAAAPVEAPLDVEAGPPADAPLVFYAGATTPSENPALYKALVERLAAALDARAAAAPAAAAAGLVANSMGWVEGLGLELLRHAIAELRIDVVLVLGADRLAAQLAADLPGAAVVRLPRSGGVVDRPREARAAARTARVEEYFYGPRRELAPASQTARFEDLQVFRVGGGPRAPASALPIGAAPVADPLKLTRVTNARDLVFTLCAVSHAAAPEDLLAANVAGFIYVQDVDVAKGTVTYLAPRAGPLPGGCLLAGAFKTYLD